jgi:AbiV family abortive infection protein
MEINDGVEYWFSKVAQVLEAGPRVIDGAAEFDQACDHIFRLLNEASLLFCNESWPTAAFLAITALEETAKTHLGMFRKSGQNHGDKRARDPLFRHKDKQFLSASPTVLMGSRLPKAIGDDRVRELIDLARSGELVSIRESCLYYDRVNDTLTFPPAKVSQELSRDLLLLALETFDDTLVGFTEHLFAVGRQADELFVALTTEAKTTSI